MPSSRQSRTAALALSLSDDERRLAYAKDALVGLVATRLATAAEGMRFARIAPGGAVPLRDGDHAAVEQRAGDGRFVETSSAGPLDDGVAPGQARVTQALAQGWARATDLPRFT